MAALRASFASSDGTGSDGDDDALVAVPSGDSRPHRRRLPKLRGLLDSFGSGSDGDDAADAALVVAELQASPGAGAVVPVPVVSPSAAADYGAHDAAAVPSRKRGRPKGSTVAAAERRRLLEEYQDPPPPDLDPSGPGTAVVPVPAVPPSESAADDAALVHFSDPVQRKPLAALGLQEQRQSIAMNCGVSVADVGVLELTLSQHCQALLSLSTLASLTGVSRFTVKRRMRQIAFAIIAVKRFRALSFFRQFHKLATQHFGSSNIKATDFVVKYKYDETSLKLRSHSSRTGGARLRSLSSCWYQCRGWLCGDYRTLS